MQDISDETVAEQTGIFHNVFRPRVTILDLEKKKTLLSVDRTWTFTLKYCVAIAGVLQYLAETISRISGQSFVSI